MRRIRALRRVVSIRWRNGSRRGIDPFHTCQAILFLIIAIPLDGRGNAVAYEKAYAESAGAPNHWSFAKLFAPVQRFADCVLYRLILIYHCVFDLRDGMR